VPAETPQAPEDVPDFGADHAAALAFWDARRMRSDAPWWTHLRAAQAARDCGDFDRADRIVQEGAASFPSNNGFFGERALIAEQRGDWMAAEGFWRAALALAPADGRARFGLVEALYHQRRPEDAAAALDAASAAPIPARDDVAAFASRIEIHRDPLEASRRWNAARALFPDEPSFHARAAEAARHARRFDEAAAILDAAIPRFGEVPMLLAERGWLAQWIYDWPAAEAAWRRYIAVDLSQWWAFMGLAHALTQSGRQAEAEAMLLDQQIRAPWELAFFSLYADYAERRGDLAEARARWDVVRTRFPHDAAGHQGMARVLRLLGHLVQARHVLIEAEALVGPTHALMLEGARLAAALGQTEMALRTLADVRARFPHIEAAWLEAEPLLRAVGRFEEAEALMQQAMGQFPTTWLIWRQAGIGLVAREKWADAVRHWHRFGQRFPGPEAETFRLQDALLRLADVDPGAAEALIAELGLQRPRDAGMETMVMAFESLGGEGAGGGCEFGSFQRDHGADPLGLLRWATVVPASLIACLEDRFAGMGDPATTEVVLNDHGAEPMWEIHDIRYGIQMHSFVPAAQAGADRMKQSACRRMGYLRGKLLETIEEGEKVLVLKSAER
jgi:tetratricopeptide (TPR) repeat protein